MGEGERFGPVERHLHDERERGELRVDAGGLAVDGRALLAEARLGVQRLRGVRAVHLLDEAQVGALGHEALLRERREEGR